MTFTHAPDWSWAKGSCANCPGTSEVRCEVEGFDLIVINERWLGYLTRRARQMRAIVEDQIASQFKRWGCPHVGRSRAAS